MSRIECYRCTIPFKLNGVTYEGEYNAEDILKIASRIFLNQHGYFYFALDAPQKTPDVYTPSSTAGDYSPSHPWDAPGMSVRDFI